MINGPYTTVVQPFTTNPDGTVNMSYTVKDASGVVIKSGTVALPAAEPAQMVLAMVREVTKAAVVNQCTVQDVNGGGTFTFQVSELMA